MSRILMFPAKVSFIILVWAVSAVSCKKEAPPPPPPPVVQVAVAFTASMPVSTEFIGQLDSPQNVEVRARVEAFVESIPFAEGTEIKQGDPLFVLDKKPFQERLAAAAASLAEAQAALNKYEKDVARLRPLVEKKAVPQQDLDNAMASVDVGKAGVLMAQARVDSAKIDLGYCDVFAPVSGLIGAKQVSVGELVGKGQPTLLATISTLDPIWFHCNISEVQYLRAETETRRTGKGMNELAVSLILADGSTHAHTGKFVFIDRAVDPKTGTLRARVAFANPDRILRPGMFARIKVDLGTRPDCILVPERAVAELQGKTFLWVIGADNKATQRAVQVGERFEGKLRIVEGLAAGDRYVLEGQQKVREGALVTPMTNEQMSKAADGKEKH
jgi:RND family efflux transporter MFP subunit